MKGCFKISSVFWVLTYMVATYGDVQQEDLDFQGIDPAFSLYRSVNPALHLQSIPGTYSNFHFQAGYWNDKLALMPYSDLWTRKDNRKWSDLLKAILRASFDLKGLSPEDVSKRINNGLGSEINIYAGSNSTWLASNFAPLALEIVTVFEVGATIPTLPFRITFPGVCQKGTSYNVNGFRQELLLYTDISSSYSKEYGSTTISDLVNDITWPVLDLYSTSVGYRVHLVLGHEYLSAQTTKGNISISPDGASLSLDGSAIVRTSGTGIYSLKSMDNALANGFSVAGWGIGTDVGLALRGDRSFLGLSVNKLGFILWNNSRVRDYVVRAKDIDVQAVLDKGNHVDFWSPENGGELSNLSDSLHPCKPVAISQATSLQLNAGTEFYLLNRDVQDQSFFSPRIGTTMTITQGLVRRPGQSFIPQLILGAQNSIYRELIPFQAAFLFGGEELVGSSIAFGVPVGKRRLITVNYRSIGTLFWYPKRGMEISLGISNTR